jgi:prepilin-type N-terminal cleavage/methylation domain-containing protein
MKTSPHLGAERGFTIIEVMIVLAVSGLILASAAALFSNKQSKTEFAVAANQFQTQIQAIINDAGNGYNPTGSTDYKYNFQCSGNTNAPPTFTPGYSSQGSNGPLSIPSSTMGCIFLGKVMDFGIGSPKSSQINIYSIVGNQDEPNTSIPAEGISDSDPILLANTNAGQQDLPQAVQDYLEYGTYIECVQPSYSVNTVFQPSSCNPTSSLISVAFTINSSASTTGGSVSASSIVPLNEADNLKTQPLDTISQVNEINAALTTIPTASVNPAGGVYICLTDGTRSALLSIGVDYQAPIVNMAIKTDSSDGDCL